MKILVISSYSQSLVNFRGVMLRAFKDKGHEVFTLGPDHQDNVDKTLSGWGIHYDTYFLERTGTNIFNDIKSYKALKKKIYKIEPDIVMAYTIKPVIYGSLAAKNAGVKSIYALITGLGSAFDNAENSKSHFLNYVTYILYKLALHNIEGTIFQNPDDRDIFINKRLVSKENSYRIYGSGVDVQAFHPADPVTEPMRFLFIGRLLKEKGIIDFIEAARIIKKRYPKVEFHVVGQTDSNPSSLGKAEIRQWVKQGLIVWHGWVKDVRPYIKKASVFVLPSYREGTPRTGLECMAMGKPLIMTDAPGCRETVKESMNGYLVPVKDPESIAGVMEKFIQNPDLVITMGRVSRKLAEDVFDVHKVNQDIIDILSL